MSKPAECVSNCWVSDMVLVIIRPYHKSSGLLSLPAKNADPPALPASQPAHQPYSQDCLPALLARLPTR